METINLLLKIFIEIFTFIIGIYFMIKLMQLIFGPNKTTEKKINSMQSKIDDLESEIKKLKENH